MAFTTVHNGIVISEGKLDSLRTLGDVKCDLGRRPGAQFKSLRDVKDELCRQAKNFGANAILEFTYGQKSRWLAWDDVSFYGKGIAVTISEADYQQYLSKA